MHKVIYFENDSQGKSYCAGHIYYDFLDYAFARTDYFMLVYVDYYGKGYTKCQKYFRDALNPFKIKNRTNPSWPGTPKTFCRDTSYDIVFYRNCEEAKNILKRTTCLSDWSRPEFPEDLAFFKGNKCWSFSVGHEGLGAIIDADENDLDFIELRGLSSRKKALIIEDAVSDIYDEHF